MEKQKAMLVSMRLEGGGFDVYQLSDGSVKSISDYGVNMKLLKIREFDEQCIHY
jgi:hypothetical protein